MGARGKKRRRADGSVAGKAGIAQPRPVLPQMPEVIYEALDPVPVDVLAAAVDIGYRYVPLDGSEPDKGCDWDWESMFDAIDALASVEGVDNESLSARTYKLIKLLNSSQNQGLYSIEDGKVVVDSAVLEFAASSPTDNSNKPLLWPQ